MPPKSRRLFLYEKHGCVFRMLDNGSKPLRIGQTRRRCAVNSSSALLAADGKCSLLERVNELRPFSSMFCDMFIAGNFRAAAMYFKNRVIRVVPKTVRLYTEHRMASF